jgi:hypothetical protein
LAQRTFITLDEARHIAENAALAPAPSY